MSVYAIVGRWWEQHIEGFEDKKVLIIFFCLSADVNNKPGTCIETGLNTRSPSYL